MDRQKILLAGGLTLILIILVSSYVGSTSPRWYGHYAEAARKLYIITGSVDKSEYKIGDTVNISGTVMDYDYPQQPVVIQVSNPRLDLFRYDKVMLSPMGAFTDSFKLEGDKAVPGTYQIILSYFGSKIMISISVIGVGSVPEFGTSIIVLAALGFSLILFYRKQRIGAGKRSPDSNNSQKVTKLLTITPRNYG